MKQEYIYPERYYHITQKDLGKKVVLRKSKDVKPKGVSFSPSISGALNGVPFYFNRMGTEKVRHKDWQERKQYLKEGNEWNVYTPVRKRKAVIPSTIDDFHRTRERRVLDKVEAKKVGTIKVKIVNDKWKYDWI